MNIPLIVVCYKIKIAVFNEMYGAIPENDNQLDILRYREGLRRDPRLGEPLKSAIGPMGALRDTSVPVGKHTVAFFPSQMAKFRK